MLRRITGELLREIDGLQRKDDETKPGGSHSGRPRPEALASLDAALVGACREVASLPGAGADLVTACEGDLEARDAQGLTSLLFAASQGHAPAVERLLDLGADAAARSGAGTSLLMEAAASGSVDVMDVLVDRGAHGDMEAKDNVWATALLTAARSGHAGAVRRLLELGADAGARTAIDRTVLMAAAEAGSVSVVDELKRHGALGDLEAEDWDGSTALLVGASCGQVGVVRRLLEVGASADARSGDESNAMMLAAEHRHLGVIDALVEAGAQGDLEAHENHWRTVLIVAAEAGHPDIVRRLLALGANPTASDCLDSTALMVAAYQGHVGVIDALAECGGLGDVDAEDEDQETAAWTAAAEGHTDVLRRLLELGADPRPHSMLKMSLLAIAASGGHVDVIDLLVERGVHGDLEAKAWDGSTAIWNAASNGHPDAVLRLLALGADPRARNDGGLSVLMKAVQARPSVELIDALVEHGARDDFETVDTLGRTPLLLAAGGGHSSAVGRLLDLGADAGARSRLGGTALMAAARCGSVEVIDVLVERGVQGDLDAVDEGGWTALLDAAATSSSPGAVRRLLELGADAGVRAKDGTTLLMAAAESSRLDSIGELVELGVQGDLEAKRRRPGQTALRIVALEGRIGAVQELLDLGADPLSGLAGGGNEQKAGSALEPSVTKLLRRAATWRRRRCLLTWAWALQQTTSA